MARLLIIGYGNPLRGDDGFGLIAAERLRESIGGPEVDVLAVQQLTPELMEPISRAERVLFLDARVGGEPGELRFERVRPDAGSGTRFTHFSTPGDLLAGARCLYGTLPGATLASVAAAEFALGAELSAGMQQAMEEMLTVRIPQWINGWEPPG